VQLSVSLAPEPRSAQAARRFVRDTLASWDREEWEMPAALLVTELVTNAVLHARTPVTVALVLAGDALRIAVRDGSLRRPALRPGDLEATTGRGLALIVQLGRSWGVEPEPDGKTVWVELGTVDWDRLFDLEETGEPRGPHPGAGHGGPAERVHGSATTTMTYARAA
jgi:anti-sigma regulatory factor (Ser/Thr protein kinase)